MTNLVVAELKEQEAIIERGLKTYMEVGQALQEIRNNRLYREQYDRFEDYCRERWGFTDRYARMMIESASTAGRIEQSGTIVPPATESQARPLTQLPPDEQADAWEEVVDEAEETGERITAKRVQQVVARRVGADMSSNRKVTVQIDVLDADWSARKIAQATSREFSSTLASALTGVIR